MKREREVFMFNKKNNFVVHYEHERKGPSRKTWIIIGSVAAGVIVLVVALVLLIPLFQKAGNNGLLGGNNGNPSNQEFIASEISIVTPPNKTVYFVGDTPNYAGLKVGVARLGDVGMTLSYEESYNELTITGFDSSAPVKEQVITVQYKGFTATFTVEIKELPPVQSATLTGIRVDPLPDKLVYKLGESPDYTGAKLLCEYSDGSIKELTLYDYGVKVSGFGPINAPGEYDITVEYFDDKGGYASTTFKITMTE